MDTIDNISGDNHKGVVRNGYDKNDLARRLFKGDLVIWFIFVCLCVISIIEVFSATSTIAYRSTNYWEPIARHISHLFIGFVFVLIFLNIPYKKFKYLGLTLPVAIFLLAITPFVGTVINGEPRWLSICGINFQPSEIAKICSVCFIAYVLSKLDENNNKKIFWIILGFEGVTTLLIFGNNGSTAVLLFCIMLAMMFVGGIYKRYIFKLIGLCFAAVILAGATLYYIPESAMDYLPDRGVTWKHRIERFLENKDRLDTSDEKALTLDDEYYQEDVAKIAIAQGGIFGKMPGHGQQRDWLPQAYSDFIYAIIIEELGIVGGIFVLFLYIVLLIRVGVISKRCKTFFPKYLVLGCGLMLVTQAFVNMAVAVGVFPVTGQPLPLISRGGTSTIISCLYIGIILSVSRFSANIGNEDDDNWQQKPADSQPSTIPGVTIGEIDNWIPESKL